MASRSQEDHRPIAVSPRHTVRVAADYVPFIDRAPQRDFVVRTVARKQAGSTLLMTGDLVIASAETREQFPLAAEYPLHFRKAYYPGKLHRDPQEEFDNQLRASELLGVPAPIGCTPNTFRSCLIPGEPLKRLSPFGSEPEDSNIATAEKLPLNAAAGLWYLLSSAFEQLMKLHAGGMVHGDAELVNFIVCPCPLEVLMIDFETAQLKGSMNDDAWAKACARDVEPLLREAVFLQCGLGRQQGPLADAANSRLGELFKYPDRFVQAIEERTGLGAA